MLSERVFRSLLIVYPREHRREYGELMVQLFRDRMRRDGNGFGGLAVWLHMTSDLAVAAFKEHKEGTKMRKFTSIAIALAVLLVAGGIGAGVILAGSNSGPVVSVSLEDVVSLSVQETDEAAGDEPQVVVSCEGDDGTVVGVTDCEAIVPFVSWQEADAPADGAPKISVSWQKADEIASD